MRIEYSILNIQSSPKNQTTHNSIMLQPTNGRPRLWNWRKIFQYFLQGILVVAPVSITIYLIYWFVSSVDNLVPIFTIKDESGHITNRNYGLEIGRASC